MDTVKIYGIPNCDTVKKAITYLKDNQVPYTFHNFKTDGISPEKLKEWFETFGFNKVVNKSSSTYRALEDKSLVETPESAIKILEASPSMIKRPILENGANKRIGFKKEEYDELFLK
jgi:arsenate reductase